MYFTSRLVFLVLLNTNGTCRGHEVELVGNVEVSKDDRHTHTESTPAWIEAAAAAAQIRSPTFASYFTEDLDGLLEKCNEDAVL